MSEENNIIGNLAKKTGSVFAGVNVTVFIVVGALGGIIGVSTPLVNQLLDQNGMEKKITKLEGRMLQAENSLNSVLKLSNSQAVEISALREERQETELLIQRLKLSIDNKDTEIAELTEKNKALTLRIEELEKQVKQS